MLDNNIKIESPIQLKKNVITIDTRKIEICTTDVSNIREKLKKYTVYTHCDGKEIHIVKINNKTGDEDHKKINLH